MLEGQKIWRNRNLKIPVWLSDMSGEKKKTPNAIKAHQVFEQCFMSWRGCSGSPLSRDAAIRCQICTEAASVRRRWESAGRLLVIPGDLSAGAPENK